MVKRFRQRAALQNAIVSQNEYADNVPSWSTFATRWVSITPVGSKETYIADQQRAVTTHKLETWYDSTVIASLTAASRVVWDGRTFHLTGAPINEEENTRKMIVADLVEVSPDG